MLLAATITGLELILNHGKHNCTIRNKTYQHIRFVPDQLLPVYQCREMRLQRGLLASLVLPSFASITDE